MGKLSDKKILMFVDHIYEDLELWYPKIRMEEEGAEVVVAGPEKGELYKGKHGYPCVSDEAINNCNSNDFDALIIAGGFAPDKLRRDKKVLELTSEIFKAGKPVAHICHGGWIPVSAKIVDGFKCTSSPGIKDDLTNAGVTWMNEPVVIDRNMVSSRSPKDLPQFCKAIIELF